MASVQLTDLLIRKVKREAEAAGKRLEMWDDGEKGLFFRVSPGGSPVWFIRYRLQDHTDAQRQTRRRLKLGRYTAKSVYGRSFNAAMIEPGNGPLTLKEARLVAKVQRGRVASQRDPQDEKVLKRQRGRIAREHTIDGLAKDYMNHQRREGRKTWQQDQRRIDKDVIPVLGDRPASEVKPEDVQRILDRIQRRAARSGREGKFQANRVRALLVSLFNFALLDPDWRQVVSMNPAMLTRRPLIKERARTRVLSDEELRRLWEVLDAEDEKGNLFLEPSIGAALRLQILLGQRWIETRTMQWADLSVERVVIGDKPVEVQVWRLPGEWTKNGKEHLLPLSPQAVQIIEERRIARETERKKLEAREEELKHASGRPNQTRDRERIARVKERAGVSEKWVFPALRKRKSGEEYLGDCNRAFGRWREKAKVPDLRHSDLRRTLTTGLSRLAVRHEVKQAVLNHSPQDVTRRHYDHYDQLPEMRQALFRWGEEVDRIISGKTEQPKVRRIG